MRAAVGIAVVAALHEARDLLGAEGAAGADAVDDVEEEFFHIQGF